MELAFQEEIEAEKARGRSVLLSSHILSEAEALADRVSIIRDGVVVETGTLDQLRHRTRTQVRATLERTPHTLAELSPLEDARLDGLHVRGAVDADRVGEAMTVLGRYGIAALTVSPPSLEELFLRHEPGEERAERAGAPGVEPVRGREVDGLAEDERHRRVGRDVELEDLLALRVREHPVVDHPHHGCRRDFRWRAARQRHRSGAHGAED